MMSKEDVLKQFMKQRNATSCPANSELYNRYLDFVYDRELLFGVRIDRYALAEFCSVYASVAAEVRKH